MQFKKYFSSHSQERSTGKEGGGGKRGQGLDLLLEKLHS